MYVVMNFGMFVCSPCAGIHREMTHKVKGISMSNFSEDEIKTLTKLGNLNQQANLMAKWSDKRDSLPPKDDTWKMKDFFRNKYIDKKFASKKKSKDSSDDNSDDSVQIKSAHGFSYHNGPEWVWLYGFYVAAKVKFDSVNTTKDQM